MASRLEKHLSPWMQHLCGKFLVACDLDPILQARGVRVILTCTYRSNAEQADLYAQGRTKPGPVVTRAQPGQSKHNAIDANGKPASEAFDIALLYLGKCVWSTEQPYREWWDRLGAIAEDVGLEWYGRPGAPFREFVHFQNPEA